MESTIPRLVRWGAWGIPQILISLPESCGLPQPEPRLLLWPLHLRSRGPQRPHSLQQIGCGDIVPAFERELVA